MIRKCIVIEVTPAHMLIDKAEVMTGLLLLPPVTPKMRMGKWIPETEDWRGQIVWVKCSECGFDASTSYKFCPNCGADMREEGGE